MISFTSLKQHLSRQLGFLVRSCDSYDAGYVDESIRIATVIRVLIHDTKHSTSLLRHLCADHIKLASTVVTASPNAFLFYGMGSYTLGNGGGIYRASTSDIVKMLPVPEWWNQITYIHGKTKVSRKDIVLAAANKDGGAHVDEKLTPEYAALSASGALGFFSVGNSEELEFIVDGHLAYIRQMGYELLNSPELLNLRA